jgi:hypothetical protein
VSAVPNEDHGWLVDLIRNTNTRDEGELLEPDFGAEIAEPEEQPLTPHHRDVTDVRDVRDVRDATPLSDVSNLSMDYVSTDFVEVRAYAERHGWSGELEGVVGAMWATRYEFEKGVRVPADVPALKLELPDDIPAVVKQVWHGFLHLLE